MKHRFFTIESNLVLFTIDIYIYSMYTTRLHMYSNIKFVMVLLIYLLSCSNFIGILSIYEVMNPTNCVQLF